MDFSSITFSFFLIFTGAAVFASLALYTRQPLIIAYIALGACIGPYGLSLVTDLDLLTDIGHVGIIFLLFLLGLDMQPQALWVTLRKSVVVAVFSSCIFLLGGCAVAYLFGYSIIDSLVIGAAMMFSSTIIGIKLLPTTVLHHRHIGELMINITLPSSSNLSALSLFWLFEKSHSIPSSGSSTVKSNAMPGSTPHIFAILLALCLAVWRFCWCAPGRSRPRIVQFSLLSCGGPTSCCT